MRSASTAPSHQSTLGIQAEEGACSRFNAWPGCVDVGASVLTCVCTHACVSAHVCASVRVRVCVLKWSLLASGSGPPATTAPAVGGEGASGRGQCG